MLVKKLKFVLLISVFALFVYINIHLKNSRVLESYILDVKRGIEKNKGNQNISNNITNNLKLWEHKTSNHEIIHINTIFRNHSFLSSEHNFPATPASRQTTHRVVTFPSATNCSRKQYNSQIKKHKGVSNPTRDLYPCRLWREVNLQDPRWPPLLTPSNGSILKSLPVQHHDSQIQSLISEQMEVQKERVARLTKTCLSHPEIAIRQYTNLVWDTSRTPPVIYCPIYKVASTTWMVYFLRLAHVNDHNTALDKYKWKSKDRKKYMPRFGGGHRRVFQEYKAPKTIKEKNEVFRKSLRFIVVRHPFARLLSAYRDKIETPKPKPFVPYFLDLQRAIILKYRLANSNITTSSPTFSEFVNYVIESTANLKTAKQWFEEVVCWAPYWVQCGVCASDYQLVIKLETMTADEQFLAQVASMKEIENVHEWRNLKKNQSSSTAVLPDYYKNLSKRQILLLYDRFKLDFDLFGYSVNEYLKYATH